MPLYFQRPENALKRANEFIDVGEKQWALDALYDVIKSRKHRTWQKIHEPIMIKYLELCVDLKKSHVAKEGLYQYRNICQQVNIKSLEDVVRGYLKLAEEKTEAAKEESQQAVDIDDLDQLQTPESLLLSAVSSEDRQDRTDRVVLTPWVKFLWESYRQCLELLRNNSRVERLYHDIAQQAFKFCINYNRKTEFRKLCDNLRTHLGHIHKHQNQQTSVNLNNPESQAMHLETRLVQLDSAILMELWQEAYKAIEDIYNLMGLSKKAPNPRLMANYYQKLSLVFWKSNNYLFHAAALFRLFYLSREQKKNITSDEITRMAAHVVLATLAVPMPPNRPEIDRLVEADENVIDKNHRLLATLLGLPNPPTRAGLIKDLVRFGIIQCAPAQLQDLYRWLEIEFHPLQLCSHVQKSFDFLNKWDECPDLRQYIPSIQNITTVRLIKKISQVYQTIKFSKVLKLAPFIEPFELEYLVAEIARRNDLQVRIDHRKECFHFGSELNISQRDEIIEGPVLQSMPTEQLRKHLVVMHTSLVKATRLIDSDKDKRERVDLRKDIIRVLVSSQSKDRLRILSRQQIIEERKEMLENLNYQKEAEERKLMEDKEQKLREAEKERMARETEERTKQRLLREQTEMKRKVVMEKIEQLKKTEIGSRIFEGMDEEELQNLDPDDLLNKQVEQLDRERKELQTKLRQQERKVDHIERAKRQEEIPLLQSEYDEFKVNDFEFWEQHEKERIKAIKEERALAIQERNRLIRMKEDRDKFLLRLQEARSSLFEEKMSEFKKTWEAERKNRLTERKLKRKEERKIQWLKEQEEKQKRLAEEKLKKEREEHLAKLEEIEAKKRAREEEVMKKMEREERRISQDKTEKEAEKNVDSPQEWRKDEPKQDDDWRKRDKGKDEKPWRKDERLTDDKKKDDKPTDEERKWRRDEKPDEEKKWRREEKPDDDQKWRPDEKSDSQRRWRPREDNPDNERRWRRDEKPEEDRRWRRDEKSDGDRKWRRDDKPDDERRWRRDEKPDDEKRWRRDEKPEDDKRWRRDEKSEDDKRWRRDEKPEDDKRWRRDDKPRDERSWRRDDNQSTSYQPAPQKSFSKWREGEQDRRQKDRETGNDDISSSWRKREEPRKFDDRNSSQSDDWKRREKPKEERGWRRDDNRPPPHVSSK